MAHSRAQTRPMQLSITAAEFESMCKAHGLSTTENLSSDRDSTDENDFKDLNEDYYALQPPEDNSVFVLPQNYPRLRKGKGESNTNKVGQNSISGTTKTSTNTKYKNKKQKKASTNSSKINKIENKYLDKNSRGQGSFSDLSHSKPTPQQASAGPSEVHHSPTIPSVKVASKPKTPGVLKPINPGESKPMSPNILKPKNTNILKPTSPNVAKPTSSVLPKATRTVAPESINSVPHPQNNRDEINNWQSAINQPSETVIETEINSMSDTSSTEILPENDKPCNCCIIL